MILVTGANGHLGRAIVEHLSQRTAPAQIIAASREPDSLSPPDGVAVRRADFADPASLPEAFAGIERIEEISLYVRRHETNSTKNRDVKDIYPIRLIHKRVLRERQARRDGVTQERQGKS